MSRIASLPMYDLPEIRSLTDAYWEAFANTLRGMGLDSVPERLLRDVPEYQVWCSPDLLLGQTCGYPLTHRLRGQVQLVGRPCYAVPGCEGGRYHSLVIVRSDSGISGVDDLFGKWAINAYDSLSGYWLFLASPWASSLSCDQVNLEPIVTGGHRESARLVRAGKATFASIDCVVYSLLQLHCPQEIAGLDVIGHTVSAPSLPYITSIQTPPGDLLRMREALRALSIDPRFQSLREGLLLQGFEVTSCDDYAQFVGIDSVPAARQTSRE